MLHAFIDESEYGDKYFILSALVIDDTHLPAMERALRNMLEEYASTINTPSDPELHGYDLMQQKHDWSGVHMNVTASIYKKALGIINAHASALYIETIDREAQRARYKIVHNHRTKAIGFILERVNEFALTHEETVDVYLDEHYTAQAGRREFLQYKLTGTSGYRSSQLRAITALDFYDSRSVIGIQAADLCCYVYNRTLTAKNRNPRAARLNTALWDSLSRIRQTGRQRIWPHTHEDPA